MDTRAAGDVTPHLTTGDARHREHPIPLQDMIGTRLEDSVPRYDALHDTYDSEESRPLKNTSMTANERNSSSRFERPDLRSLAVYTACCALIYPFLYVITLICNGRSLFEVRLYVGLGCTVVSTIIGIFLLKFAKRFIEASTWATLLQQNHAQLPARITLQELSELAYDPTSLLSAVRMLFIRRRLRDSMADNDAINRRHLWHSYILFFALFVSMSGVLSFAFGRIVDIVAQSSFDYQSFEEVPVFNDLSAKDVEDYSLFNDYSVTTTFDAMRDGVVVFASPTTRSDDFNPTFTPEPTIRDHREMDEDGLPPSWKYNLPSHFSKVVDGQHIYFSEPYVAQIRLDGIALGSLFATSKMGLMRDSSNEGKDSNPEEVTLLRYPQWGVNLACDKLSDPNSNLISNGSSVTIHLPRDFVSELYSKLGLDFHDDMLKDVRPVFTNYDLHSEVPSRPDVVKSIEYVWYSNDLDNGRQLLAYITDNGKAGIGWTLLDVFLFRLNTRQASASSRFAVSAPHFIHRFFVENMWIGHEVAVCIHRTEPWIIEVSNSTRFPQIVNVLGRLSDADNSFLDSGSLTNPGGLDARSVIKILSSQDKYPAYLGAYTSSTREWLKLSGDIETLTPVDASWTDGMGYLNFTNFDISLFEDFRGVHAGRSQLPLLAGSQQVLTHRHISIQKAFARILPIPMAIALTSLVVAGAIGCLCIPALPGGHPQRRFDLYSWVAAMKVDGLKMDNGDEKGDGNTEARTGENMQDDKVNWRPHMDIGDIEKQFGSLRIRYVTGVQERE